MKRRRLFNTLAESHTPDLSTEWFKGHTSVRPDGQFHEAFRLRTVMTFKHLKLNETDADHVTVTLDTPDRPVNILNAELFADLDRLLRGLSVANDDRPIIFRSAKAGGFIAGADLKELTAIQTRAESDALVQRGLSVFRKLASLRRRTVAVVHGACLGGGLEFALACSDRIAFASDTTQLGLPEVNLGLIPGWGGTFRLPRLIGMKAALRLMLSGRSASADEAAAVGLVNLLADEAEPEPAIRECLSRTAPQPENGFAWNDWWTLATAVRRFAGESSSVSACRALVGLVRRCRSASAEQTATEISRTFAALLLSDDCRQRLNAFFEARRRDR